MTRDLVDKLQRMAARGTPHEANVARSKLAAMAGRGGIPPRLPAAPAAAPAPEPEDAPGWFTDDMRDWRMRHRSTSEAWTMSATAGNVRVTFAFRTGGNT